MGSQNSLLVSSSFGVFSLSQWERAGVRERSFRLGEGAKLSLHVARFNDSAR